MSAGAATIGYMNTAPSVLPLSTSNDPVIAPALTATPWRERFRNYAELTKPRIATMALVTVAVGFALGAAPHFRILDLLHTLFGSWCVAAGGSVLNCWLERRADGRMHRTKNRPVVTGKISPGGALAFGLALSLLGVAYLAIALPSAMAAIVAAVTVVLYVAVYTPLKRMTAWNTVVGAIPGALPPLIGWAGATGGLEAPGWALFAVLFVWQLPHFYSIAFMYREDYALGGMKMLPCVEGPEGKLTGLTTLVTGVLLFATTALPFALGATGWPYLVGAMPMAAWFVARCYRFHRHRTVATARTVLRGSLVYLLAVMFFFVVDGIVLKRLLNV